MKHSNNEGQTKNNLSDKIGVAFGLVIFACAAAILIAGTYKLIGWIL